MREPSLPDWRPSAARDTLKARAELLVQIRTFFAERSVLEVETPVLSAHASVDRHIESFMTLDGRWLQTSPEFAMKRLLASGSGPICQVARVFRREEAGRFHSPEFTLLEWYRPGFDHLRLMDEVEALLHAVGIAACSRFERLDYRQAFVRHAGFDPFTASLARLADVGAGCGVQVPPEDPCASDREFWLDVLMSHRVGPALGLQVPMFLYDFPASQAALARIRPGDPPLAERFELFWKGVELANGFHELGDAAEQRNRFQADQERRRALGQVVPPFDAHLIGALASGFPDCAGVAIGLDRLLMLKLGLPDLASTLAFASDRA